MGFLSKIFGTKEPHVGTDGKVGCKKCGARILPLTAKKYNRLCAKCFKNPMPELSEIIKGLQELTQAEKAEKTENDLRICHGCGKQTDKRLKLITDRETDVLVRSFCSEECSIETIDYFSKRNICIWCGKSIDRESIVYGWLKEPYCSQKCYKAAGKAMASYEVTKGNLI